MPKYLFKASYTAEGLRGLLKEGGSARRAHVEELATAIGGRLEGFYFAFGEHDVFAVVDAPGNVDTAALALAIGASGAANLETVVLLTPEEVDEAARRNVGYRPPGA